MKYSFVNMSSDELKSVAHTRIKGDVNPTLSTKGLKVYSADALGYFIGKVDNYYRKCLMIPRLYVTAPNNAPELFFGFFTFADEGEYGSLGTIYGVEVYYNSGLKIHLCGYNPYENEVHSIGTVASTFTTGKSVIVNYEEKVVKIDGVSRVIATIKAYHNGSLIEEVLITYSVGYLLKRYSNLPLFTTIYKKNANTDYCEIPELYVSNGVWQNTDAPIIGGEPIGFES